ncbi:hypothetical protein O0235_00225 [Tepidiforma flava]|uniref:UmuC domain-containing protein n=1 Tax=Tepidiforma flava TaxID=3004094 RepID=A0ABY7MCW7_9CHLR|nr:hypothetical protein [Tepidiforma flava]WBL37573.1 hypothetical protein O0235_00225 [Tepidiforma flava]
MVGGSPEEHAEVTACSAEAMAAGVAPGMSLRRALALCPGAVFLPLAASAIRAEAERLAELLRERTPRVEEAGEGHLHCEIRGCRRSRGWGRRPTRRSCRKGSRGRRGCRCWRERRRRCSRRTRPAARWGWGSGWRGARRAAAGNRHRAGAGAEFLAHLPVEVLPVEPAMHQRLRLFGIERLGQLAGLPLSALQAQFGPAGRRAWELANGRDDARLQPAPAALQVREEVDLPAPAASLGALLAGSEAALGRAFGNPELQGRAVRIVTWWAGLEDGTRVSRRLAFREPTADPRHALFVLRGKLETLRLAAPAVSVGVELDGACSEYAHQQLLWAAGQGRRRELDEAIAQLHARAGGAQVFRIVEVQPWSRIPERQLALVAYGS